MEPREFVIPVRRRWTLWILPVIALAYFAFVVFLATTNTRVKGVETQHLVWGGAILFALVLLIQLPFLFTRRVRPADPDEGLAAEEPSEWQPEEAPAFAPPPAAAPARDDELLATAESQKGLKVLEYSAPAKSRRKGAVYAKTYVPVTKEHVLRVETLAADRHEL